MIRKTDPNYREELKNFIVNGINKYTKMKDFFQRGYFYWGGDENFEMNHDLYEEIYEEVILEMGIAEQAHKYSQEQEEEYKQKCLKLNGMIPFRLANQ